MMELTLERHHKMMIASPSVHKPPYFFCIQRLVGSSRGL
jgi:hypothetical protein